MVFHGILGTCSSLKLIVCVCFEKVFVLLRFNLCFCLQECYEVFLKTLFEKKKCKCESLIGRGDFEFEKNHVFISL